MKSAYKILLAGLLCAAGFVFSSCYGNVTVKVQDNGTADYDISLNIGATAESVIRSVTGQADAEILDRDAVAANLAALGCTNIRIDIESKPGRPSDGSNYINIHFTAPISSDESAFVASAQNKRGLSINVQPQKIKGWAQSLPEETKAYVDLLMAPVVEGELMSPEEYTGLVGAVYGKALANEMTDALVRLTIIPPNGAKKTEHSIPLTEILTLSRTKTYKASW